MLNIFELKYKILRQIKYKIFNYKVPLYIFIFLHISNNMYMCIACFHKFLYVFAIPNTY